MRKRSWSQWWINQFRRAQTHASRRRFLGQLGAGAMALAVKPRASARLVNQPGVVPAELQGFHSGKVITKGDANYEIWRQSMSWQAIKPERYPDVLAQASNVEDVQNAVRWARSQAMKIGIRSGGHSWVHNGIRNGGLLLDLGGFNDLVVDAEQRTAIMQPAITSREVAAKLEPLGLAFPVAHCSTVPMGGYLLGSGQAWNQGAWGPACYSVNAIDVVTANGDYLHANSNENADLLWAARGGGPGFPGVIVNYHVQLQPLPIAITTSTYMWPIEQYAEVAPWMEACQASSPSEVEVLSYFMTAPPDLGLDCATGTKLYAVAATAFANSTDQARAMLKPFSSTLPQAGCLVRDEYVATPFPKLFEGVDLGLPRERFAADTFFFDAPVAEVLAVVQEQFSTAPSPLSLFLIEPRHPVSFRDGAYSMAARTFIATYAIWRDADDDELNSKWLREAAGLLEPLAVGHFIAETNLLAGPERAKNSYAPENWQRLQTIRDHYDPDGLFHTFITPQEA